MNQERNLTGIFTLNHRPMTTAKRKTERALVEQIQDLLLDAVDRSNAEGTSIVEDVDVRRNDIVLTLDDGREFTVTVRQTYAPKPER